ncbi:MAG TPA: hypothetical protein VF889_05510 [Bacteroidota bacterium]
MNGNAVQIPSEKLIELIVREVVAELARRGVAVSLPGPGNGQAVPAGGTGHAPAPVAACPRRLEIDFTDYKTPVLTEHHVRSAGRDVREIIVPAGTVCTIGARDLLQQRHLTLTTNGKKH